MMLGRLLSAFDSRTVRRRDIADFEAGTGDGPTPDAGPIERLFFGNSGPVVHKWHHYLPVYDRHFAPFREGFRGRPLRFLEIGVYRGGSLAMWRSFFGPEATIFGIDIDPSCAILDGKSGGQVRIGSQDDAGFLRQVVSEMGGVDIVLDDGSHKARHMRRSFDVLFPLLSDGGLYVIEDLQCAYWTKFGGGYQRPGTFIETAKQVIDDMHHWWHGGGTKIAAGGGQVAAMHVYDSIIVLDKDANLSRPVNSRRGGTSASG